MNYKSILMILLVAVGFSCEEYLEEEPITEPQPGVIFSDQGTIELLLAGAYEPMRWEFNPRFGDSYSMTYMYTDVRSDDVILENHYFQPHGHGFENFVDLSTENVNVEGIWAKLYAGVARANQVITGLQDLDESVLNAEVKNALLAEARFLRAYYYFDLVRNFGDVPLFGDEPIDIARPETIERKPKAEVYAQIESDLLEATTYLPVAHSEAYRATLGAAWGLLSKVYLYEEKWQDAADAAQAVIDLGVYSLEENYADNFSITNEFGKESIFEINYTGDPAAGQWSPSSQSSLTAQFFSPNLTAPVTGWDYNLITPELQQAFADEGDEVRRKATIILEGDELGSEMLAAAGMDPLPDGFYDTWVNSPESGGQRYGVGFASSKKYFLTPEEIEEYAPGGLQLSPLNHKVMRYAEVLLILAEATINGASGDGQGAFDQVRTRAGLPAKALTMEDLKLERRLELATEWNRFHDLIRWGDASAELEGFSTGRDELLPIPYNDIVLTGKDASGDFILEQNQGYQ